MTIDGEEYWTEQTEKVGVYSFEIESAKATKVNEITVTFADAVDSENVTFAVTKGTDNFSIEGEPVWSLTEDEAVLTMSANMTTGTYTVTATDKVTEATDYYEFEVKKQEAAQIVFLNEVALTNEDKDEAYAYYDVLDQYDQSIRTSASIQWSGSCVITADKATGKLTLTKNAADDDWVYNEQIYITGVYVKNGTAASATLTVGTQQSLDSIEMVGFLKKGTSEIIDPDEGLPADFKTQEYYLLFNALDQNGCPLDADDIDKEDITFISTDPLVVKELTTFAPNGLTVKGQEYCAVFIEPGINVSKGGEVTIKAIANKTGNQAELNFIVGDDPVPVSFTIDAPSGTVADGDTDVVIPFTALDQDGKAITNFRALAKQEIFNKLSFTASEGTLTLKETDSGAAALTWDDANKYVADTAWALSSSTDDIDRPVSLTVVVVGGESDNEMMYVSDKRRPDAIDSVDLDSVLVEGATKTFTLNSFRYKDQYGELIDEDEDATDYGDDNGFFAAGAPEADVLHGLDFADYTFGVKIEYAGTGYMEIDDTGANKTTYVSKTDDKADGKQAIVSYKADQETLTTAKYDTTTNIKSAASGEGFKFSIAKFKKIDNPENFITNPDDWDAVSPTKYAPLTVVDITQVKNFKIGSLNTFYVGGLETADGAVTGNKIIGAANLNNLKDSEYDGTIETDGEGAGIYTDGDYRQTVKVTGTYNSTTVKIPGSYFSIETVKDTLRASDSVASNKAVDIATDSDEFDSIGVIKLTDLYDQTTANGTAKLGTDQVKATIENIYGAIGYWAYNELTGEIYGDEDLTQAEANATLNDAENQAAYLLAAAQSVDVEIEAADMVNYPGNTDAEDLAEAKADAAAAKRTMNTEAAELTEAQKTAADALWNTEYEEGVTDDAAIEGWTYDGVLSEAAVKTKAIAYLKARLAEVEADAAYADAQVDNAVYVAKTRWEGCITDNNTSTTGINLNLGVYDSAVAPITFSDQAPYAASIDGLADAYTLNPEKTVVGPFEYDDVDDDIEVLDQYGVTYASPIYLTVSNAAESSEGYADNNFKVTGNGSASVTLSGAERADTFDLVLSVPGTELTATTKVTIGADGWAAIVDDINLYTVDTIAMTGLKATLEAQRLAGLQ